MKIWQDIKEHVSNNKRLYATLLVSTILAGIAVGAAFFPITAPFIAAMLPVAVASSSIWFPVVAGAIGFAAGLTISAVALAGERVYDKYFSKKARYERIVEGLGDAKVIDHTSQTQAQRRHYGLDAEPVHTKSLWSKVTNSCGFSAPEERSEDGYGL